MRKNNGIIAAEKLLRKYRPKEITYEYMKNILEDTGYTIVEFGSSDDSETIIHELNLRSYADNSRGFTYADSNYRLVFINDDLSEEEKRIVISHEAGHIFCRHLKNSPVIGEDVIEEYEANEFVHRLLNLNAAERFVLTVRKHKIASLLCTVIVILSAAASAAAVNEALESKYYGEYYVTGSGTKYHTSDCYIIQDKRSIRRLTNDDMKENKYEPCEICIGKVS